MSKNIKFTPFYENVTDMFYPKPAYQCVPDWYKKEKGYTSNKKEISVVGESNGTIKKCMPVFDSITSGYIIFSMFDIQVVQKENGIELIWPQTFIDRFYQSGPNSKVRDPIQFHVDGQVSNYPGLEDYKEIPKFINPWSIKTTKGYSVFVTTPMHRDLPFKIFSGIVDTDFYNAPINFPFIFTDTKWEGLIPAGTPIAQVIPFKRDSWKMSIGNEKDFISARKNVFKTNSFFTNAYKNLFWQKKLFK